MAYDFTKLKTKITDTETWLKDELGAVRTGRATPALVENIQVEYYGSKTPLKNIASIGVEDARTLRIVPWETDNIRNIESAISNSTLGAQPVADEQGVRISLPAQTEENRNALVKVVGERLEKARISLRVERDETWKDIQQKEKESEITEDDKFMFKDEMQKIVDEAIKIMEEIVVKKEEELKM